MEDPVSFDIWCLPYPEQREASVRAVMAAHPEKSRARCLVLVSRAVRECRPLLAFRDLSWAEVTALRSEPPAWAESVIVVQAGCDPQTGGLSYCETHDLRYGGCLGCHVCTGFYREG
jgi:hypothetical protein